MTPPSRVQPKRRSRRRRSGGTDAKPQFCWAARARSSSTPHDRSAAMSLVSGADAVVTMLQVHGVKHLFGLCGDTSLPFYDALSRLDHGITHVLTRDERSAAYMADGYARVSGK